MPENFAGNARERGVKKRGWGFYASHIGSPGNIYMRRWILRTPFGTLRVHNIMRSDDDRHLHDHPFDFTSFLLSGGYEERTPKGTRYWPRFSVVTKRAEDLHCLTLDGPVWTFVVSGPVRREWGFSTERGWIHNEHYFEHFRHRAEWKDLPDQRDGIELGGAALDREVTP